MAWNVGSKWDGLGRQRGMGSETDNLEGDRIPEHHGIIHSDGKPAG
jgi:hypothetical protein